MKLKLSVNLVNSVGGKQSFGNMSKCVPMGKRTHTLNWWFRWNFHFLIGASVLRQAVFFFFTFFDVYSLILCSSSWVRFYSLKTNSIFTNMFIHFSTKFITVHWIFKIENKLTVNFSLSVWHLLKCEMRFEINIKNSGSSFCIILTLVWLSQYL